MRGLNLQQHYEQLLPNYSKGNEAFVPIPNFKNFLVVHPYNMRVPQTKNTYHYVNRQANTSHHPVNMSDMERLQFNFDLTTTSIYRSRRGNALRASHPAPVQITPSNQNEAKISDFDLNHLFLLNKCN